MSLVARDPRSDKELNSGGNAQVGAPGTAPNTNAPGGYKEIAAVDLGNGTAALAVIAVTRTKTTVTGSATSEQLLAADVTRLAATIQNTDATHNMYVGLNGATAVAGTNTVPPNGIFNVPVPSVAAQVNGVWDTGVTGGAAIMATTA